MNIQSNVKGLPCKRFFTNFTPHKHNESLSRIDKFEAASNKYLCEFSCGLFICPRSEESIPWIHLGPFRKEYMKTERLKISQFWEWFSLNCNQFGLKFENEGFLKDLDGWVTNLGDFNWELGPGTIAENMLVISPAGRIELLSQTEMIISKAPKLDGWEFYPAKPPKKWALAFDLYDERGGSTRIDASSWEYILLKYDDGFFEIIIKAPIIEKLDVAERQSAAEILLDGVLGERTRILTIAKIDVVSSFEEKYDNKGSSIKYLAEHIVKPVAD